MSHIFISYSRKDISFARKVVRALAENKLDTWIDWEDIPKGEDWMERIQNGIEQADAFLFLVSPDSIKSEVCNQEIDHAVQNGKRILPIIIRDIPSQKTHPEISKRNWIFCREGQDDFNQAIDETRDTIHTDYEWLQFHTELLVKALKWQRSDHEKSLLLRGRELESAESMLGLKAGLEPQPVDLQREYILRSRQAVNRQRRQITIGLGFGVIAMAILAVFAWRQRNSALDSEATAIAAEATAVAEGNARAIALVNEKLARATAQAERDRAEEQAKISRAGELAAQAISYRDEEFLPSLLLGAEAYRSFDTYQSRRVLLENIEANPRLHQYLVEYTGQYFSGLVFSVDFSSDGKMLAADLGEAYNYGNTIILWDIESGQLIGDPLHVDTDPAYSETYGLDENMHAYIDEDGKIILWDTEIRQIISEPLNGDASSFSDIAFSPVGNMLASGSKNGEIMLWDVESGQLIGEPLRKNSGSISYMAFSPDGKLLASGNEDGGIILWDVKGGQLFRELLRSSGSISDIVFSPDGNVLASSSEKGEIMLWDVESGRLIGEPLRKDSALVSYMAFSPDGKLLAFGNEDGEIMLWDVESGQPIGEPLNGDTGSIFDIVFSPVGNVIASGSENGEIMLWDVESGQPIGEPLNGGAGSISTMAFSPDGKLLASGSTDYSREVAAVILWDVERGQPIEKTLQENTDQVRSVAFSPDGEMLASGGADGSIILWNVKSGRPIGTPLKRHTDGVSSVAFSPDGNLLASGGVDGSIILWNVESRQPIREPLTGSDPVHSIAFSPNGKLLAYGCGWGSGDYESLFLLDVESGESNAEPLRRYDTNLNNGVTSVAFSPDGKILASGSEYGEIILLDVENKEPIGESLNEHIDFWTSFGISSLVFSPDGGMLASASGDGTIYLWNVESGQPVAPPLTGPTSRADMWSFSSVNSVVFNPDGDVLASADGDGAVILWDVESGQPIGTPLKGHTDWVNSVAFSPDGKILASGGDDGDIILWNVDPQGWLNITCQRVGRNFTIAEWNRYFPGEDYRITCPQWSRDLTFYKQVAEDALLLNADDQNYVQTAFARVKYEMQSDLAIRDKKTLSLSIVRDVIEESILNDVNYENWERVFNSLEQARNLEINIDNAELLNQICWDGSVDGYAETVLQFCEQAVQLFPSSWYFRDSRGLARALVGDFDGAIQDFTFFIEHSNQNELIEERQQWISELEKGNNPFTADVLESLKYGL